MAKPAANIWYIWKAKPGKVLLVEDFIKVKVPEVASLLCPYTTQLRTLKSGRVQKKVTSLYGGYIFLNYAKSPSTYHKIKSSAFIECYVGSCTEAELVSVYKLQIECSED